MTSRKTFRRLLLMGSFCFPFLWSGRVLALSWTPAYPEAERACSRLQEYGQEQRSFQYWEYRYDSASRLAEINYYDGPTALDALSLATLVSWSPETRTEIYRELGQSAQPTDRLRGVVYDETGRRIETFSQRDGEITQRQIWRYNEAGQLTQTRFGYTATDEWTWGNDYVYDAQGRLVSDYYTIDFPDQPPFRQWQITYAADGLSAEVVRSQVSSGIIHSREQLTFDLAGRLIQLQRPVLIEGSRQSTIHYAYDVAGRIAQIERLNEHGDQLSNTRFRYDSAGRLIEQTQFYNGVEVPAESISWDYACWNED